MTPRLYVAACLANRLYYDERYPNVPIGRTFQCAPVHGVFVSSEAAKVSFMKWWREKQPFCDGWRDYEITVSVVAPETVRLLGDAGDGDCCG